MSISAGVIDARLELDTGPFYTALNKAKTSADGIGGKLKGMGDGMTRLGKGLTLGMTAPLTALGVGITKVSMDFEQGMSRVKAISGASAEDMEKLKQKAKDMGATTKFSATESADALNYMAMAGWSTSDMLDGLEGVMNLAAASGEDLAMVSDIVTDGLSAFGLKAKDSGHFADVLAKASSSANTNVGMMGQSFKYVAPVAGALGYTIEDTALALGLMANAGIKSSQAGTSLRSAMTRLAKPTGNMKKTLQGLNVEMFDTSGKARPLRNVLDELRTSFKTMSEQQKTATAEILFGKEAMAGMLAVLNSSDEDFNKFVQGLDNAKGSAKDMSDEMMNNVAGQLELLKSNLGGLALQIGDVLLPIINKGVVKFNEIVTKFSELSPATQEIIVKAGLLATALGPLLIAGGKVATGTSALIGLFGKFGTSVISTAGATTGVTTALGSAGLGGALSTGATLFNPWTAGLVAVGVGAVALSKKLKESTFEVNLFSENISEATKKAVGSFLELEKGATSSLEMIKAGSITITEELKNGVLENVNGMKDQMLKTLDEQEQQSLESLKKMLEQSTEYSEQEKQTLIENAKKGFEEKRQAVEDGVKNINDILTSASEEHRTITEQEWTQINEIMTNMTSEGVEILSGTKEEHQSILEEMKKQSTEMTAEMASQMISKSEELKKEMIKNAEEQYKQTVQAITNMKTDGSKEAEDLKKTLIEKARKQKEDVIKEAKDMHSQVVNEAKSQAGDLANALSSQDGTILTNWQRLKSSIENNPIVRKITTVVEEASSPKAIISSHKNRFSHKRGRGARYSSGTNYSVGGYALVGEHGPEMVYLPKGSRVKNNSETKRLQSATITNNFNIPNLIVREEADINKIAKKLDDLQRRSARSRGLGMT